MDKEYYWSAYKKSNTEYLDKFWHDGGKEPDLWLCDGEQKDKNGVPLEQYSFPLLAIGKNMIPHIAVGVLAYKEDVLKDEYAEFFFQDINTGEELEVGRWQYIRK
jgi:hypothetical protein